jgi:hypothetical protein
MSGSHAILVADISGGLGTLTGIVIMVLVASAFIRWLLKPR